MHPIIESFDAVTCEWLEEVLRMPPGALSSCILAKSWETPVTQVALIRIGYKAGEAVRKAGAGFSRFMDDRLSQPRRLLIDRIVDNIDRALGRSLRSNNLTLIHRDTHLWNFFFPRCDADVVKLFDWQSFGYGLGAEDLVDAE